jgi:hypothetical protein
VVVAPLPDSHGSDWSSRGNCEVAVWGDAGGFGKRSLSAASDWSSRGNCEFVVLGHAGVAASAPSRSRLGLEFARKLRIRGVGGSGKLWQALPLRRASDSSSRGTLRSAVLRDAGVAASAPSPSRRWMEFARKLRIRGADGRRARVGNCELAVAGRPEGREYPRDLPQLPD